MRAARTVAMGAAMWLTIGCPRSTQAQPPASAALASSVDSPSAQSLLTFAFLDALSLARQTHPTALCAVFYVELDRALDALVDLPDWQHIAWRFSRSGIYDTLDGLIAHHCDEDLGHDVPSEHSDCANLRAQGRRQLYRLEQTDSAQAVIHSRQMHVWTAHLAIGKQTGCLMPMTDR